MSKDIVVIGNGFDLQANMSTRFEDFVNSFQINQIGYDNSNNFIVNVLRNLSPKTNQFNNSDKWLNFFGFSSDLERKNWMDVEQLLNNILYNKKVFSSVNSVFEGYTNYLISNDASMPNTVLAHFAAQFKGQCKRGNILTFLKKEISVFEDLLSEYLNKHEGSYRGQFYRYKEVILKKLTLYSSSYVVLNFNYTECPSIETINIHGSLQGSNKTNIIIGVDPTNNIGYKELSNMNSNDFFTTFKNGKEFFTKAYRRMLLTGRDGKQFSYLPKENECERIIFYGHSLGEQDYSYFQSLFDKYDLYGSNLKLVFYYSTNYLNHNEPKTTIQRVYSLINEYGLTLDNKDHGLNLLNKIMLEGRLLIEELKIID